MEFFMDVVRQLNLFMEPASIALIGVPRRTGRYSLNILENMLEYGYTGKIYPINPGADRILGVKTYSRLRDVPGTIDMALIATPRTAVLDMVKECADKGIRAVAILTQGFSDFDQEGRELEAEMVKVLHKIGGRLLGPNTLGVANAFARVNTSFSRSELTLVPVGTIVQTGSLFTGSQKLLISGKSIDLGNSADIGFTDGLRYYEDDTDIKVIAMYMEGVTRGREFMETAKQVSRKKPVLVLKSGRTPSGSEAAKSHTAQMAGKDEIYDAVFRQCGVMRVADVEELSDLSRAFSTLPLMKGPRLGIITMSGSGGVLAADACQSYGLEVAQLLPETKGAIQKMSLPWITVNNPVDVWPVIFSDTKTDLSKRYVSVSKSVLEIIANDPGVDGILLIAGVFNPQDPLDPTDVIMEITDRFKEKPIACVLHGRNTPVITEKLEQTGRTVVYSSFERAVRALGRLYQYAKYQSSPEEGSGDTSITGTQSHPK
jgi:acetate---CoA ligase (ADP-forming)